MTLVVLRQNVLARGMDPSTPASQDSRPPGDQQTALITGATAGIGLTFSRQLAARGYDLVLVARDAARLAEVAETMRTNHGREVEILVADLTDPAQLAGVEGRVADPSRPIDLVVNNAGFGMEKPFLHNTIDQEQAMLDILVVAVLRISHAALGAMTERGRGGLINVSSVAGFMPRGTYGAAKAWVNSFSEWAAMEYADRGVRVMALCPGFVKTEFHQRMGVGRDAVPASMWLDADFLVDRALTDFDRGKTISIPGARYKAIVAATKFVPQGLVHRFRSVGRSST
ncbi:MAG: SDR family NAD(P)-dependent oxidoreductase [Nocardioides sp.]